MIIKQLSFVALLAYGVSSSMVSGQTVVGKSAVDGKIVELLSDQTWRFIEQEAALNSDADCTLLQSGVSFCGSSNSWKRTDVTNSELAAQYHYDDRHYGQFVIEELGSDDGLSPEFFRKIVVENAANAAGVQEKDVAILEVTNDKISGTDAETLVYHVTIDGLNVVFANTVLVLPKRSIQTITFSVGNEFTDKHRKLHAQFIELTRIE